MEILGVSILTHRSITEQNKAEHRTVCVEQLEFLNWLGVELFGFYGKQWIRIYISIIYLLNKSDSGEGFCFL